MQSGGLEAKRLQGGGREEGGTRGIRAGTGPSPWQCHAPLAQRVAGGGGAPLCQLTSRLLEGLVLGASVMSPPALPTALPRPHRAALIIYTSSVVGAGALAVDLLGASGPALEAVIRKGLGGRGQMPLLPRHILRHFMPPHPAGLRSIKINKQIALVQDWTVSRVLSHTPPNRS